MDTKQFRYPGVQPFRTSDRHLFFGRDEDRDKLYNLILLEKMLVLFGKSGYGKSSLLNAAIIPLLTESDRRVQFVPLEIKFGNYVPGQNKPPLEVFHAKLDEKLPDSPVGAFLKNEGGSLWHRLKCKQPPSSPLRIVLIFDQFEEFFSYPPAWQENLRWQLAELLFTDIPQVLRDRFDDLDADQQDFLSQALHVKVVFSIRSDRMSLLDSMKDALPTILHRRYELRPLTKKQAEEAIVKPAIEGHGQGDWQEKFNTPPFEYQRAALDAMLRPLGAAGLDHAGEGVEAFLLQILCEHVEDLVKKGGVPDLDGNGLPDVTPAQLPDMRDLLGGYLHRKLDELDPARRPAAQRLLEDGLLAEDPATGNANRTSVDSQTLLGQFRKEKLTQQVLDDLERNYLARRERNTVGGYSYELSHDRLVEPVQQMKKERLAKEEKLQAAKRQRRLIGIIALVALVAGGAVWLAVWALGQKNDAVNAKEAAQQALINSYHSDIARFRQEIGMAERNLTSYKLYGADPDVILLDSNRIDSLMKLINTLQSEIKSLEK